MNILQVSYTDLLGQRFNGHDLAREFAADGHDATQAVWYKHSPNEISWSLRRGGIRYLTVGSKLLEYIGSLQSVLHPAPFGLLRSAPFRQADIVHYQIIHLSYFGLLFLPLLTRRKPAIWSFHDLWPLTGRCIHPFECGGWLEGCPRCPNPSTPLPMLGQGASRMYRIKKYVYERSYFDIIVFSSWLLDRVRRSPLVRGHQSHLVPPGLDTDVFRPGDKDVRKRGLGIDPCKTVVAFRSSDSVFKGLPSIREALSGIGDRSTLHLLTCGETGLVEMLKGRFPVTELGEIDSPQAMADFYQASDMFLMPSTAESFGMMAAEAASCGLPCIVFDDTPLPETCFADKGGAIAVPQGNAAALAEAVLALADAPSLRSRMSAAARALAKERYDFRRHAAAVMRVYETVLMKRGASPSPRT